MPNIATLILGAPQYHADTKSSSAKLAVTFEENVQVDDLYLEVKIADRLYKIPGIVKDAKEAYPERHSDSSQSNSAIPNSSKHIHFSIEDLIPNQSFTYKVKSKTKQAIYESPNVLHDKATRHQAVTVKAPPTDNFKGKIRIGFGADQEIMDLIQAIKADDKLAKAFGLSLDQSTTTAQIYEMLAQKNLDLFIHGGDLMYGENSLPKKMVTTLEEFRHHLYLDFHQIVRTALKQMYALRGLDDHDLGRNNASKEAVDADPHAFENALNAFNEFFPVPTEAADQHRGSFFKTKFGPIEIWCLNTRLYNTEGQSLLGDAQFKWLEETLSASTAKVKLVLTPLPLVMGKKPAEDHRGNAQAWLKLVNLLFDHNVNGVLSADIHARSRVDLAREKEGERKEMFQIISGALGGRPQSISKAERKQLPRPLLPEGLSADEKASFSASRVRSYYTPLHSPTDVPLLGGIGRLPLGKKKRRAYKDEAWVGKSYASGQYGIDLLEIDTKANTIHSSYIAVGKKGSKAFFTDEATYSISPVPLEKEEDLHGKLAEYMRTSTDETLDLSKAEKTLTPLARQASRPQEMPIISETKEKKRKGAKATL
ncbi:MAG: alkaline phosphatase D family protein [Candidatus Berkiella sp.]